MEHQHPLGTGNGISAREAEQIKKLITDLTSTVEILDADIAGHIPSTMTDFIGFIMRAAPATNYQSD